MKKGISRNNKTLEHFGEYEENTNVTFLTYFLKSDGTLKESPSPRLDQATFERSAFHSFIKLSFHYIKYWIGYKDFLT